MKREHLLTAHPRRLDWPRPARGAPAHAPPLPPAPSQVREPPDEEPEAAAPPPWRPRTGPAPPAAGAPPGLCDVERHPSEPFRRASGPTLRPIGSASKGEGGGAPPSKLRLCCWSLLGEGPGSPDVVPRRRQGQPAPRDKGMGWEGRLRRSGRFGCQPPGGWRLEVVYD